MGGANFFLEKWAGPQKNTKSATRDDEGNKKEGEGMALEKAV